MNSGRYEAIVGIVFILIAALLSAFFSHFTHFLIVFLVLALFYQFFQIKRLESWLRQGGTGKQPKTKGIWEGIYYQIYRIKKSDKRKKKRLSEMLKQFRNSTSALPYAAVILGEHDQIEWLNKVARKTLGLKKSDKGQRLPNLIRNPQFSEYLSNYKKKFPVTMVSPINENQYLEFRIVQYSPDLRLLLAHDVTKMKIMERMRKDFVANVSHELRTPLTVLKGYLETLEEFDDGHNPLMSNSLMQMQAQTFRMEHLVDDLLLLTRLETKEKTTNCVNVKKLLTEICSESNTLQEAQGRVILNLDCDKDITGDEQELRSAFTNLIINAIKYSSEDTPVTVNWHENEQLILLDVVDLGEGISLKHIPRITERFYRVDVQRSRNLSGTGLGLAIVKHVLVRHDAILRINSELGKGSTFRCEFKKKIACCNDNVENRQNNKKLPLQNNEVKRPYIL